MLMQLLPSQAIAHLFWNLFHSLDNKRILVVWLPTIALLSMPEYKNQHYVPRAHFKPFSRDGAGRAINLYLLKQDRRILNAPITGQCAKPYFYGEDGRLEKLLGQMEGAYASLVSRLVEPGFKPDQQDRWLLRYFVLFGLVPDLCRSPISLCHLGFERERADAAQI